MTRAVHMQWCKDRALEYCDMGDPIQAWASLLSDLSKHEETKNHAGIILGLAMTLNGSLEKVHQMREFIEGFH